MMFQSHQRRTCSSWLRTAFLVALATSNVAVIVVKAQLLEGDRIAAYHARHYTWPPLPDDYTPNTPGWRKIFERRFRQLDKVGSERNSYNGYMSAIHAGLMCPNFTESGWGLTRAPELLVEELRNSLYQGLADENIQLEGVHPSIETDNPAFFIPQYQLNEKVLAVLHPLVEAWSGVKLIGNNAYGLRVYRNNSRLNMHIDKSSTHVVSVILHVDHDQDSEPWPIVIEDYQGNTNAVNLQSGDMLFYESSKNYHGRPKKFNGNWYSSIFVHYYPVEWDAQNRTLENHYRIPTTWNNPVQDDTVEDIEVVDTSAREPSCPHHWCAMSEAVVWNGPAEAYGVVQSATGKYTLDIPPENKLKYLVPEDEL